jgi:formylmethanofuran dehydrogenase subunit E
MKTDVDAAVELHGHLSPGVALGIRMSRVALERLGARRRDRRLLAIAETPLCLPDAIQVVTGCTLGNKNMVVKDYGKLALTLIRRDINRGVRVALRENGAPLPGKIRRWVTRRGGKKTRKEEHELAHMLLNLDERYLTIAEVELKSLPRPRRTRITACEECGELAPRGLTTTRDGKRLCRACTGKAYYRVVEN